MRTSEDRISDPRNALISMEVQSQSDFPGLLSTLYERNHCDGVSSATQESKNRIRWRKGREQQTRVLLDAIPRELLDNVLRFFSRLPESEDWVSHLPLEFTLELYGVTGKLVTFMKPRFNTLCISHSFKSDTENEICSWKKRKGSMLWTNDLNVARRFVLAGGGQSLRTIIVGLSVYHEDSGTEIADDFHKNCPNVRSLGIEDGRGVWISRFGHQLKELEITTVSPNVIAKTCNNLRELHLPVDIPSIGSKMWQHIGTSLECLTMTRSEIPGQEQEVDFKMVSRYCRNLRRICTYGMENWNKEISYFLASFGNQLQYCHVESMNERELTTIRSACKNARFSAMTSPKHRYRPYFASAWSSTRKDSECILSTR